MAYEPGSYLKELRAEHQRGEHAENENPNCQACNFQVCPGGFNSLEEFDDACWEIAGELQVDVDAHLNGEHKLKKVPECIECAQLQ